MSSRCSALRRRPLPLALRRRRGRAQGRRPFRAELGPISGIPERPATSPADQHFLSEIPEPPRRGPPALQRLAFGPHRVTATEPVRAPTATASSTTCWPPRWPTCTAATPPPSPPSRWRTSWASAATPCAEFMRWSVGRHARCAGRPRPESAPTARPATASSQASIAEQRPAARALDHLFQVLLGRRDRGRGRSPTGRS